jgi:hypothetical protein
MVAAVGVYKAEVEAAGGWLECSADLRRRHGFAGAYRDQAAEAYFAATGETAVEVVVDKEPTRHQVDLWLAAEDARLRRLQLAAHRRRIARMGREAERARAEDRAHGVHTTYYTQKRVHEYTEARKWLDSLTKSPAGATVERPARSRGAGRPAPARRRSGASSCTSSADPGDDGEPSEPSERLCECGCGRDISHKKRGARTAGPSCRSRLARAEAKAASDSGGERWQRSLPLAVEAAQLEMVLAVADHHLADRTGRPLVESLRRAYEERQELLGLDMVGARRCEELHGDVVFQDPDGDAICVCCGRYRGRITARVNGYDALEAFMRTNGVVVRGGTRMQVRG